MADTGYRKICCTGFPLTECMGTMKTLQIEKKLSKTFDSAITRRKFNKGLGLTVLYIIYPGIAVSKIQQPNFTPEMPDANIPANLGQLPNKPQAYEHRYEVTMQNPNDILYFGVRNNSNNLIPSHEILPGANQGEYFVNVRFGSDAPDSDENIEMVFSDQPVSVIEPEDIAIPEQHMLYPNAPNPLTPFNPTTRISYELKHPDNVQIKIYNALPQLIKEYNPGKQTAGLHSIEWDGTNIQGQQVGSGPYFIELRTPTSSKVIKAVKLK